MNLKFYTSLLAIVLVGVCSVVSATSKSEWDKLYRKLFEEDRETPKRILGDGQLMVELISLKNNLDLQNQVDENKLKQVGFWYDAITNIEPESQCTHSYWEDLNDAYYDNSEEVVVASQYAPKIKDSRLLELARRSLIEVCRDKYIGLSIILARFVGDSVNHLKEIYRKTEEMSTDEHLNSKKLVALARKLANVTRFASKDKLKTAWQNGVCIKILNKMQNPAMSKYDDFAHLAVEAGEPYLVSFPDELKFWIHVVRVCRDLDFAIEDANTL